MKRILLGLVFFMISNVILFSQGNDCGMATAITTLDGSCLNYNNNGATFDLANGDCAPTANAPNVWFSFVAQGPEVNINVNGQANTVYVAIIEFAPTVCDFASATQIACGSGTANQQIISNGTLTIGNTYYLVVNLADGAGTPLNGPFQICVENLVPQVGPPNDLPCSAQVITPNGVCNNGTTINGDSDFTGIPGCPIVPENGVFYEFTVSSPNLAVAIDLLSVNLPGDVAVLFGQWATNCNGNLNILDSYCGTPGNDVIQFNGVVPGQTYIVYVATDEANEGDFQVCVTETGPPPGCSVNNTCGAAEFIPGISSNNTAYTCIEGCNILASPEPGLSGCNFATEEVVWYTFTSDAAASLMTVTINPSNASGAVFIEAPSVQIFTGNCNGLIPQSNCVTGSGGVAQIVNNAIPPNSTIYIAVSNGFGSGGNFELCVLILDDPSNCVLDAELVIVGTSLGSPLDGPFQPNETVSFCYTINSYTSAVNVNNCQWLQGIIPIFGPGWSPTSFNGNGMPISNTGVSPGYGAIWGWYTNITYNTAVTTKTVGDFDGDGDIEMCHYTEPDCPNTGITAGQIMPPGWFAWQSDGVPPSGNPNVDWGSGSGCNGNQGPWTVCFDLITLSFPECDAEDPQITDTSVKIYTTSDGETGSWTGGISVCADDIPIVNNTTLNCCIGPVVDDADDVLCPGGTTNISLSSDQTGNITYMWTVIPNPNVSGYSDGMGNFITQTLINNSNGQQVVFYEVTAVSEEGCFGLPTIIPVTLLPAINVDAGAPIDGCAQGIFNLGGAPTATGGNGSFTYNWQNSNVANVSNPTVTPNVSTTYTVIVTDGNGCTSSDNVTLTINPRFDVDITGDTLLCPDLPESFLNGSPLGGTPGYTFQWAGTGTSNSTNQNLYFDGFGLPSGDYLITLTVTDNNGCTGDKEVTMDIFNDPQLFISSIPTGGKFCPGGSINISAAAILGEPGVVFTYTWTTPSGGTKNGQNIVADETGYYVLEVTDNMIMCVKTDSIFIEEIAAPEPIITSPSGVCPGSMVYIKTDQDYTSYLWSNASTSDSILVSPGTYNVTVTNIAGCTGTDVITVNPFPPVTTSIGGSSSFCVGSSSILSVSDNFTSFQWTNANGTIISTADTAEVFVPGTVSVLVYDSNGCSASATTTIQIQNFLVPNVLGDTSICPAACTNLNAGAGYIDYLWSTGDTIQTINVCSPGSYAVTVFDAGGCSGEQTKIVTENDLPTPQILGQGNQTSFCPGDDLLLDAGSGYIAYLWDDSSQDQSLSVNSAGTYTVTVTDAEGCQATADITVTQNVNPVPGFTGDTKFCFGDSVEITPEAGYNLYEIDIDNNGVVDITNSTNLPFFVSVIGNSSIVVTDANGCEGEVLVPVSQFTSPKPVTLNDTSSYCTNGTVFISLFQNYDKVEWYYNNGLVGTTQSIDVGDDGLYQVVVTDANGCTGSTSTVVIESTQLFPTITGANATCDNAPIILDAGDGYDNYDWGLNGETQMISVTTAGTYTVTVSDLGGCSGTADYVVTNSATPMATVVPNIDICNNQNGDNISLLIFNDLVSGSQGFWADTDGSGVNLTNPSNVNFDGVIPGIYTFTYTTSIAIAPCVNQSYTMTVDVSECLCPSLQLGMTNPVCVGDGTVNLNDFVITSESGFWNLEQGTGNVLTGSTFNPANASPGTYILAFNLDNPKENCDSVNTITLEVIEPANAGNPEPSIKICLNDVENVNLASLLNGEDSGGSWIETSANNSTGSAFNQTAGTFASSGQIVGIYTFMYTVTGFGPCGDESSEVTIEIVPLPSADAGSDKELNCDLLEVSIGTNNSTGIGLSFLWTESKGIAISNPDDAIVVVDNEGTYNLNVTDINLCADRDSVIVTRNSNFPTVGLEAQDPFCFGESTGSIIANATGGQGPYEYSIDNGNTWLENDAFLQLGAGTYNVLVKDVNSCIDDETITIVNPLELDIDLGGNLLLQNVEDTLISLSSNLNLANIQAAIWTVDGSIVCEGPDCLTYRVDLAADREVCVTVTTEDGCTDTECIDIRSFRINNFYLGNVFTPNEDGLNDIFYVKGGEDIEIVDYFKIYDRWGEQVFLAENFVPNQPEFGWDGRMKDRIVQQGVYAYSVQVVFKNGDIEILNGDVTVMR